MVLIVRECHMYPEMIRTQMTFSQALHYTGLFPCIQSSGKGNKGTDVSRIQQITEDKDRVTANMDRGSVNSGEISIPN